MNILESVPFAHIKEKLRDGLRNQRYSSDIHAHDKTPVIGPYLIAENEGNDAVAFFRCMCLPECWRGYRHIAKMYITVRCLSVTLEAYLDALVVRFTVSFTEESDNNNAF